MASGTNAIETFYLEHALFGKPYISTDNNDKEVYFVYEKVKRWMSKESLEKNIQSSNLKYTTLTDTNIQDSCLIFEETPDSVDNPIAFICRVELRKLLSQVPKHETSVGSHESARVYDISIRQSTSTKLYFRVSEFESIIGFKMELYENAEANTRLQYVLRNYCFVLFNDVNESLELWMSKSGVKYMIYFINDVKVGKSNGLITAITEESKKKLKHLKRGWKKYLKLKSMKYFLHQKPVTYLAILYWGYFWTLCS